MSTLETRLLHLRIERMERRNRLFNAAKNIASWVSASLSELQPGHTGEYEKIAEEFLEATIAIEKHEDWRNAS